jgi:hypothetical protein
VRSSPSFIPALAVSTDTDDGVYIRISYNAAPPSSEPHRDGLHSSRGSCAGAVLPARRLFRALGGELWAEPGSPPGGTTFIVRFPAAGRW